MADSTYTFPGSLTNIDTAPMTNSTTPGQTKLQALFSNPNFLNMLAGVGVGLDPKGAGGALGNATIAYNRAQASQRLGQQTLERTIPPGEAQNAEFRRQTIERLGGHHAGAVTESKLLPDGSQRITLAPRAPVSEGEAEEEPAAATSAPIATTSPPTTQTPVPTTNTRRTSTQLSDLPFFSPLRDRRLT